MEEHRRRRTRGRENDVDGEHEQTTGTEPAPKLNREPLAAARGPIEHAQEAQDFETAASRRQRAEPGNGRRATGERHQIGDDGRRLLGRCAIALANDRRHRGEQAGQNVGRRCGTRTRTIYRSRRTDRRSGGSLWGQSLRLCGVTRFLGTPAHCFLGTLAAGRSTRSENRETRSGWRRRMRRDREAAPVDHRLVPHEPEGGAVRGTSQDEAAIHQHATSSRDGGDPHPGERRTFCVRAHAATQMPHSLTADNGRRPKHSGGCLAQQLPRERIGAEASERTAGFRRLHPVTNDP